MGVNNKNQIILRVHQQIFVDKVKVYWLKCDQVGV